MISFEHYLIVSTSFFMIGVAGLFLRPGQVFASLICVQMIVLAAVLNLVASAHFSENTAGQLFAFVAIAVSTFQSVLGIAICVSFRRRHGTLSLEDIKVMKG